MSDDPAGWQPDPSGKHDHRYWDGSQWTDNVADAGVASTDPYGDGPLEPTAEDGIRPGSTEPTVVTPVADTTASYPTGTARPPVPPPYLPPSPIAGDGGDGGGKRRLMIGGAILAAVAIAVIAFLALGDDDDEPTDPLADGSSQTTAGDGSTDDTSGTDDEVLPDGFPEELSPEDIDGFEDEIAETYQEAFGLSEDQSRCLAEQITDAVDDGDFNAEQITSEFFNFLAECDISMEEIGAN